MPEQRPATFDERLHAAIRAGWRTLVLGIGVVAVQWIVFLAVGSTRPAWFLAVWGHDATWSQVQGVWLAAIIAQKVGLFGFALVLVWATWWRSAMAGRTSISRREDAQVELSFRPAGG